MSECPNLIKLLNKIYCKNKFTIHPIDLVEFNSIVECCKDCYVYKLAQDNTELKKQIAVLEKSRERTSTLPQYLIDKYIDDEVDKS